jgi:hypothetical protein
MERKGLVVDDRGHRRRAGIAAPARPWARVNHIYPRNNIVVQRLSDVPAFRLRLAVAPGRRHGGASRAHRRLSL